ncbi:DUF1002 domain-containing protein [Sulfobacillus harzensis]|uniref:DUF1002 domain-containing protein n=1 Tax=Sulfobacillus harzensis TaxID=2729629 RepID=A0A7Y0L4C7_9FIRM|nr:DUF1002 domain-containing protein [Sulfobacillus harzensis]NMP22170.1 DUF1002 domain-containing protein [Sulfobacillus harzensis]
MGWSNVTHRQLMGIGAAVLLWTTTAHAADQSRVVTLGANLTAAEQRTMIQSFGTAFQSARRITINHSQEETLLRGVAPQSEIGTRSISSSAVETERSGYGIRVTTKNITWVTPAMYANALATAGVTNARVQAAAPFPVSGTAALAGILTAYQSASGHVIPYGQERTAAQEMMTTGSLGDQIGSKAAAATLMRRVKTIVLQQHLTTASAIRPVVIREANNLSIKLSDTQINEITNLMVSISRLPIDASTLSTQLRAWEQQAARIAPPGFWQQLVIWLKRIWHAITAL